MLNFGQLFHKQTSSLLECLYYIHENAGYPHVMVTYENYREGFVKPIHLILDGLKPETLVWCIGDDTKLVEPDTLKRLVEALADLSWVVQPDDGIQHGNIITMPLCTAETMRKYTYKGYFLNFADNEFTDIMTAEGRYKYHPEIKVEHMHPAVKKAPMDETYAYAQTKFNDDRVLYEERKKNNYEPKNP